MRAINVFLSLFVSLLLAAGVLEVGLRVLGMGPQATIQHFDPQLGWSKTPGATARRSTREFDVHFVINEQGLRDDPMPSTKKPAGTYRVIMLGDSFVQGFTVERKDLFVDLLEARWQGEGRKVDVINAGTEGYSTDQEVAWFLQRGGDFEPDLVVLFPYENDLYWNSQIRYQRFPKPRFNQDGKQELRLLVDPGERSRWAKLALGKLVAGFGAQPLPTWSPDGTHHLPMEWTAYFKNDPEPMTEVRARTKGALIALQRRCAELGTKLVIAPIPQKASIEAGARAALEQQIAPTASAPDAWSPDRPVETFLALAQELSIPAIDARESLRARAAAEDRGLYYQRDWHFNPAGNRAFASFLHDKLEEQQVFPAAFAAQRAQSEPAAEKHGWSVPAWILWLFGALWTAISIMYALTYRDEPAWQAPLKIGAFLALIFSMAIGGNLLLAKLPPALTTPLLILFVGGLLGFVLYKLGRRLGTIVELFVAFVRRGHWYLMPLVVVLLTAGSLLVVAASSPLIAPFIYTLF